MKKIYEPWQIGSMQLKNRTFMAPMSLGYESPDGCVNETMEAFWLARAKGGVGCIIMDATSVDPRVPYLGNTLCFRDETSIARYRAFTDQIHAQGCRIIPQITHPGPESISAFFGVAPMAPIVYLNSMAQKTRALALEELPGIVAQYAHAARQAKEAGFDGIELHCAHAYMLLGSFLSPLRNKRMDAYGGSLMNRARLLFEVIDAIKEACGKDFPIILRMSGSERDPQGNTLEDMKRLIPHLEAHGIDCFEVSGGTQYERCNKIIPCHGEREFTNLEEARAIKEVASVPVITVGKILDAQLMSEVVERGEVDGVVIGRALLADEEFVRKAMDERYEQIAPCTGCGIGCVGEQTKRHPATCVINPRAGRERELVWTKTEEPKHVLVIGGGIGGLTAAYVCARRGHRVTLAEKSEELGGQMRLACRAPYKQEISKWMIYLKQQCADHPIDIRLQCEADAALVSELHPDVIIVATGAKPQLPPFAKEGGITAHDVLEEKVSIPGGNVAIIGGGMVGIETAEYLMANARGPMMTTIIEMTDRIGAGMVPNNLVPTMQRLRQDGVQLLVNTKVRSVTENSIEVESNGTVRTLSGYTHIVYATGVSAQAALMSELEGMAALYCIGDAKEPAQALEAVRAAYEVGMRL